jgi:hypothetical protein
MLAYSDANMEEEEEIDLQKAFENASDKDLIRRTSDGRAVVGI